LNLSTDKIREAFKVVYLSRERYRTTKRDLQSSLRLGALARELSSSYLEVIEWKEWKRVLALRT